MMWSTPSTIRSAVISNPWALAFNTLAALPTSDSGDSRTSPRALLAAIRQTLSAKLTIERSRRQRAKTKSNRDEILIRLRHSAGANLRSPAWRRFSAARDEWMAAQHEVDGAELTHALRTKVAPAFNTLRIGVFMCPLCGTIFAPTGRGQTCSDACTTALRQRRARRQQMATFRQAVIDCGDEYIRHGARQVKPGDERFIRNGRRKKHPENIET
jgi:hypothetical protein